MFTIFSFSLSVIFDDSTFPVPRALGVGNSSNLGGKLRGAFFLTKNSSDDFIFSPVIPRFTDFNDSQEVI